MNLQLFLILLIIISNEEGIDKKKVVTKITYRKYGLEFVFIVLFGITCVVDS